MAQLFRLNEKWPYPLTPSEYVKRQFHVSFQDDPVAVACRHITGLSTIVWGNDYPHAEGTFRGSRQLHGRAVRRRPARRARRHGRRHARRAPRVQGSGGRLSDRDERVPLRRPGRRRHRRGAGHRPRLRPAAGRARRRVVVNDLGGAMDGDGCRRRPGRRRRRPRSPAPVGRRWPTPATSPRRRAPRRWWTPPSSGSGGSTSSSTTPASSAGPGSPRPTRTTWPATWPCTRSARSTPPAPPGRTWSSSGYGRIVMTTSSGMFGLPTNMSYATAKAGVIGLTRSLAVAGRRARHPVNLIAPAAMTRMAGGGGPARHDRPSRSRRWRPILAHEACPVSGEIYAAGAGRFARIFIASTRGYVEPGPEATIEDVAAHWADDQRRDGLLDPRRTS